MTEKYTIKNVTEDLTFLLSLTKVLGADEDGFVIDLDSKERFVHQLDKNDSGKEIVIFQDPLPKGDYYFFNPFAEGFGKKSPAVQLYYQTIRIALNLDIRHTLLYVAKEVLMAKIAADSKEDYKISHVVTRMSSIPITKRKTLFDDVDETMLDEFALLFDRMNDECIHIPYLNPRMMAYVKCDALTDEKWDDKFGEGIRKKSLHAFKATLQGILGISSNAELDQFTVKYDAEMKTSAKFYTTMMVYYKLYSRFNDILADVNGTEGKPLQEAEINLGELYAVLERFPLAYAIAKHMVQPVIPTLSPTDTSPADTRTLRLGDSSQSQGQRRFAGPPVIDDFGRTTRGGESRLSLGGSGQPAGRFAPHVLSDAPADPFAPVIRQPTSSGGLFGSSSGFSNQGFGNGGASSYFGNSGGGFGGGGLDLRAPSNFGAPGVARKYF